MEHASLTQRAGIEIDPGPLNQEGLEPPCVRPLTNDLLARLRGPCFHAYVLHINKTNRLRTDRGVTYNGGSAIDRLF
jgi:hypothetical protein